MHTKEFIEKLRKRMIENNPANKPEVREKISKTWFKKGEHAHPDTEFKKGDKGHLGYAHSQEAKDKMSKSRKGKNKGKDNPSWKGDNVGYIPLHSWVYRELGKPVKCEHCGAVVGLVWANKSMTYKRDLTDWIPLCKKCHAKYDGIGLNRKRENGRFI
jgi:hypothetical protein